MRISMYIYCVINSTYNYYRCTGHVKGKNKLQIFTLRELCEDSKDLFDRISLVSQWAVNDILVYKKCKTI